VICADKTGTLTKGEMTVRRIFVGGRTVEVGGSGYDPQGALSAPLDDPPARLLLTAGALCNDAELVRDDERWIVRGDPTEAALLVLAAKGGVSLAEASREHPRLAELPFSSERKRMTTVHAADDGTRRAFVKGAPEIILERSTSVLDGERAVPMDATWLETLHRANEEMASRALRVVGLAYRDLRDGDGHDDALETGLVFLGLVGMMDPPREEAIRAVQVCREIHVRPVMITGDHRLTAEAVAKEIGILREGDLVLGGDELERLDEEGLAAVVERVSVYARVSPLDKLKIVRAWKQKGDVVTRTSAWRWGSPARRSRRRPPTSSSWTITSRRSCGRSSSGAGSTTTSRSISRTCSVRTSPR
jgi:Ca2+-transporting ATPase